MTPEAKIVKVDFCKSIIRSKGALSYEQAQNMINDGTNTTEIAYSLRYLLRLSKILKEGRKKGGSLELASS